MAFFMSLEDKDMLKKIIELAKSKAQELVEKNPSLKDFSKKELQLWMEKNLSKMEKISYVESVLFEEPMIQQALKQLCEASKVDLKLVKKTIAKVALHRRVSLNTLFNMVKKHFETDDELIHFVKMLIDTGLMIRQGNSVFPNKALQLKEEHMDHMDMFQSNPCMFCEPNKVYKTKQGRIRNGYLNLNRGVFSRKAKEIDEVPMDFLNLQNRNKYVLNLDVWEYWIQYHPELPERESGEDDVSYSKKNKEAWRHHYKKCFLLEFCKALNLREVWILNFFDYRGRNYPIAYLLNPQGQDSDKALLGFEPQPIDAYGVRWLKISIANCFNCKVDGKDLDKSLYSVRLNWYRETIAPQMDLSFDEFIEWLNGFAVDADSPACFWAQVENMWFIHQALKEGKVPMCWVITHWDATASGYQIQSIFSKDREMAKLTNLIGHDRQDLYTELYAQLIAAGIPSTYTRTQVKKKCFIPAVYNSIRSIEELFADPAEQQIFNDLMKTYRMWQMNRCFPELWDFSALEYSFYLPDGFKVYKEIKAKKELEISFEDVSVTLQFEVNAPQKYSLELGPNITHACDGLVARELARRMNWNPKWKAWLEHLYSDPSNWKVSDFTEQEEASRETMKNLLKLGKVFNFYSMRVLKEITPANIDLVPHEVFMKLLSELPENPCQVSEIHDSFGVHPNHVSALVGQYKMILRDLALSNYLPMVMYQLNPKADVERKILAYCNGNGEELAKEIMKSVYALC